MDMSSFPSEPQDRWDRRVPPGASRDSGASPAPPPDQVGAPWPDGQRPSSAEPEGGPSVLPPGYPSVLAGRRAAAERESGRTSPDACADVFEGTAPASLRALATAIEGHGISTFVDPDLRTVDAYLAWGATAGAERAALDYTGLRICTYQRVILRWDVGAEAAWWWLLWPAEQFKNETTQPEITRLLPAGRINEAARRVRNILLL